MKTVVTDSIDVDRVRSLLGRLTGLKKFIFTDGTEATGLVVQETHSPEYKPNGDWLGIACSVVIFVMGRGRVEIDVSGRVADIVEADPELKKQFVDYLAATGGVIPEKVDA